MSGEVDGIEARGRRARAPPGAGDADHPGDVEHAEGRELRGPQGGDPAGRLVGEREDVEGPHRDGAPGVPEADAGGARLDLGAGELVESAQLAWREAEHAGLSGGPPSEPLPPP